MIGRALKAGTAKGQWEWAMQGQGNSARPVYELVDMNARGEEAVATAFANQVAYCRAGGAPITARVVAAIAEVVAGGARRELARAIRAWEGAPLADALRLRAAGGIHALHTLRARRRSWRRSNAARRRQMRA